MITMNKFFGHLKTVCKHKYYVFKASCEMHIPVRGLLHDMSKFSPIEFITSAKYYTGTSSPIDAEKEDKGYSYAWLHHRGRNPHHWEYWIDNLSSGGEALEIPEKYVKEMLCDWIGAGKAYNGKNWTYNTPIEFFRKKIEKGDIKLHPNTLRIVSMTLQSYAETHDLYKSYTDAEDAVHATLTIDLSRGEVTWRKTS